MESLYSDRLVRPKSASSSSRPPTATVAAPPAAAPFYGDRHAANFAAAAETRHMPSSSLASTDAAPRSTHGVPSVSLAANPHRLNPTVNYKLRGTLPTQELSSNAADEQMAALLHDIHAPTTVASRTSHINTWTTFHRRWFCDDEILPLTAHKMLAVAVQF